MDCGPFLSHDHLDKGSFEFHSKGVPLVIDLEVGLHPERYKWFRPEVHNTVVVNGGPKYELGRTRWGAPITSVDAKVDKFLVGNHFCFTQGDYTKFTAVNSAKRSVLFAKPGYI